MKKNTLLFLILVLFADLAFAQSQETRSLKVMTYNIWNGFDWGRDSVRHEKCIQWIKTRKPDVLALQELCGYSEEKLKEDALKWGHPYIKLLKTEGYPTALTSSSPITLVERIEKPFWHGLHHPIR